MAANASGSARPSATAASRAPERDLTYLGPSLDASGGRPDDNNVYGIVCEESTVAC